MKLYVGLIMMVGLGGWLAYGLYCEKCEYKSWQDVSHFLVAGDPMLPASIVALEGLSEQSDLYLSSQVAYIKERHEEIESEAVASTREYQLGRLMKRIDQFRSEIHVIPGGCQKHASNQTIQFQCADCQSSSLVTFKLLNSISDVVKNVIDSFKPTLLSGFSSTSLAEADAMELQNRRQLLNTQGVEYSNALLNFKEAMMAEYDSTLAGAGSTLAAVAVENSLVHVEQSAGKFKTAFNTLASTVKDVTDAFYLRANEMVRWYSIAMLLFVIGASFLFISYVRSLALITNETNRIKEGTDAGFRFTSVFPGIHRLGFALKNLSDGKERIAEQLERKGQQYRALEEQKILEKQLAGVVAHEYGNKLMVMEGNLLLLQAKMESPDLCRLLNSALLACQQAKLITEEFRSSAGRQVHQKVTPIRLNSLLENQIEEMAPTFARAKQVVELDLDPQLKSIIAAKEDLDGILLNLILNAMEANEVVGGKKITIRSLSQAMVDLSETPEELASKIDSGIKYSCFEVIDEGVGIPPGLGQQVFNLGVTTKGGSRTDYGREGFGSGLHIVWDMVSANNGAVDFIRNDSMGVKFRVFLPAGPEVAEKQPDVSVIPRFQVDKGKVLLIEDDEDVREVTCAVLRESGWVVEPMASAEEALELYEDNFRMVISDIRLGPARLDGHQLVEEVRARESRIPILLVSGYTQKEVRKCDRPDDGIVGFLKKPFRPEELISAMDEVLRKAHP